MRHYITIGQQLKARREAHGLTQTEVASRLGMTRSNVSQLEAGKIRTSLDILAAYAELVDAAFLCEVQDDRTRPKIIVQLGQIWDRLPVDKQEILLGIVEILTKQVEGEEVQAR